MAGLASRMATDVRYGLVLFFRDRASVFLAFLFPVILLLVLGWLFGDVSAGLSSSGLDYLFTGILGMCILFSGVNCTLGMVQKYRTQRAFHKLSMTPLTTAEWNASRVLSGSLIVLLSVCLAIAVAWLVFGVRPDINLLSVSTILAGTVIFVTLGLISSYLLGEAASANSTSFLVILPLVLVSGSLFPVDRLPPWLQFVSILSPLTYLNNGLRSSMFGGDAIYSVVNLAICGFLGLLIFCIGLALLMGREGQDI